jgi:hypothetical protein
MPRVSYAQPFSESQPQLIIFIMFYNLYTRSSLASYEAGEIILHPLASPLHGPLERHVNAFSLSSS